MTTQKLSFYSEISQALKQNLGASVVMICLAATLGFAYAQIEATAALFNWMAEKKQTFGLWYGVIATSIFGGLIPCMVLIIKKDITTKLVQNILFYLVLWAIMGLIVDVFYQLQGVWFGYENSLKVLATKVLVDQFIFSAFLTCPILTVAFLWRSQGFSYQKLKQNLNRSVFTRSIPKTVITNWMVWLPAVCLIYSMPAPLQIPFFNLILCLFVLILSALKLD